MLRRTPFLLHKDLPMDATFTLRSEAAGTIPLSVLDFLEQTQVSYEILWHKRDADAQHTAAHTHTPRLEFAKTVVVRAGEQEFLLLLPAHHHVNTDLVAQALDVPAVHLVPESRLSQLFPDCQVGAQPPFGTLYGLPVIVAAPMALDEQITFNAGSHDCAVRLRYADFERIEKPRVINFSAKNTA
ncbi:MAG TPA: YbaK/EbsC family protein [Phycisphaerae bacterium]|nr:YbaK/EbsC family protein [Phycisphaerae bacterium]